LPDDDRIKRPAYQWYVADARGDEIYMLMTYEQRGIYRELLDHQWVNGSLPADPVDIGRLLAGFSRTKFLRLWPLISTKFLQKSDGRWINAKLEKQREILDQFIEERRKRGQIGGRRKADNLAAASLQLEDKPKQNPSSSSSSSSVKTVCKEHRQAPAEKAPSPTREFLGWFQGEYRARRNGATYFVRWDAHSALVKRLLTTFPADRLKKHAQILLSDKTDDEWIVSTDRGIEVLSSKINWLEERLCQWETARRAREAV
jgi:uncharacterized protein YdaU (DUF1376 family)